MNRSLYSSGDKSLVTCLACSTAATRSFSKAVRDFRVRATVSDAWLNSWYSSAVAVPLLTLSNRLARTLSAFSSSVDRAARSALLVAVAASNAVPRLANPAA